MDSDRIADVAIIVAYAIVIILKAVNIITVSWLWIFSPFWISLGLGLLLLAFILVAKAIIYIWRKLRRKLR